MCRRMVLSNRASRSTCKVRSVVEKRNKRRIQMLTYLARLKANKLVYLDVHGCNFQERAVTTLYWLSPAKLMLAQGKLRSSRLIICIFIKSGIQLQASSTPLVAIAAAGNGRQLGHGTIAIVWPALKDVNQTKRYNSEVCNTNQRTIGVASRVGRTAAEWPLVSRHLQLRLRPECSSFDCNTLRWLYFINQTDNNRVLLVSIKLHCFRSPELVLNF